MEHVDSDYYHLPPFKWWDSWALRNGMICPNPHHMSVAELEMRTGLSFPCPELSLLCTLETSLIGQVWLTGSHATTGIYPSVPADWGGELKGKRETLTCICLHLPAGWAPQVQRLPPPSYRLTCSERTCYFSCNSSLF